MSNEPSIVRIVGCQSVEINSNTATVVAEPKDRSWHCRVLGDCPMYVSVGEGAVATEESGYYSNEFDPVVLCVNPSERVSVIGSDVGLANICEIRESA